MRILVDFKVVLVVIKPLAEIVGGSNME